MSRRTVESGRLLFLVAIFLVVMVLIGVSFFRAISDINAQAIHILETEVSSPRSRL